MVPKTFRTRVRTRLVRDAHSSLHSFVEAVLVANLASGLGLGTEPNLGAAARILKHSPDLWANR